MPELNLTKELEVGGKKFPLWIPVVGGGIAILAVVAVKLKGKAGGGELPASVGGPGGTGAAQAGTDNTGQFQSALGQLQASLEERIAGVQGTAQQTAGEVTGLQALIGALTGQVTGLQGTAQQTAGEVTGLQALTGALTGRVTGLQTTLQQQGAQLAGYQGQLAEQAQAFQAGISGVSTAAQQFKADVNARMDDVERRVSSIETKGTKVNRADRFAVAQMGWTLARYINETRGGVTQQITPEATINAEGSIQQGTGYLLRWS